MGSNGEDRLKDLSIKLRPYCFDRSINIVIAINTDFP